MSIFGLDIGIIVGVLLAVGVVVALVIMSHFERSDMSELWAGVLCASSVVIGGASLIFLVALLLGFISPKTETTYEDGWEIAETHELVSLASFDGNGRKIEGSASAWGALTFGYGEGSVSTPNDPGVYLLVERGTDGGFRKLSIDADKAVVYETETNDTAYRAEHYKPVEYVTTTLIEPSWWCPSLNEKYADGPVRETRDKSSENDEWKIYLPAGSIITDTWDAGIGMDGETVKKGE